MWRFLILFAFALASAIDAHPNRVPMTPQVRVLPGPTIEPLIPFVAMWSETYGLVYQCGRKVFIEGNAIWYAVGEIRRDNSIVIQWYNRENENMKAIGLYRIDSEDGVMVLVGRWGFEPQATIDASGANGLTGHDWIRQTLHR